MTIYHTYCDNCDGKHNFISDIEKEYRRCKYGGVYLNNSYDEECGYLEGIGVFCSICEEIEISLTYKLNCNICKKYVIKCA